jgi:hypothetical protein
MPPNRATAEHRHAGKPGQIDVAMTGRTSSQSMVAARGCVFREWPLEAPTWSGILRAKVSHFFHTDAATAERTPR